MNLIKCAVALAALSCALGSQAAIVTANGGNTNAATFLTLASTGATSGTFSTSGGTLVATEVGGSILSASTSNSTRPVGAVGNYLSDAGASTTTLSFGAGVSYLSFLWGTPDSYNVLTVNGATYHASDFGFAGAGVPGTGGYVSFTGTNGSLISSLTFSNSPAVDAFETANFSITAPVPEPETYALMAAGLGVIGFMARRRRAV